MFKIEGEAIELGIWYNIVVESHHDMHTIFLGKEIKNDKKKYDNVPKI